MAVSWMYPVVESKEFRVPFKEIEELVVEPEIVD